MGKQARVIITERRWGRMSWIYFGKEGAKILLKSVVSIRVDAEKNKKGVGWCENGRRYRLEMRKNEHGRFLICSATDLDGKRHRLFFPEGNGLINGWIMLENGLQAVGQKEVRGDSEKAAKMLANGNSEEQKEGVISEISTDLMYPGRSKQEIIWVNTSEYNPKGVLGLLKYGIVGRWKTLPITAQTIPEVTDWAKRVWRLKGRIAIHPLNQNLFLMGFELSEEAIWVMENGSRTCRGGVMQMEWWSISSGCKGTRDQEKEAWIRVVGLPLHLWTREILEKVGDSCGGFVAMDEGTDLKIDLLWARILVRINNKPKIDSINLIAGDRSYVVQIWWEIRPTVTEVMSNSSRSMGDSANTGENDDREARAKRRVSIAKETNGHSLRDGMRKVGNLSDLGNCEAINKMETGHTRGANTIVGDKKIFEIQNGMGIRRRKWMQFKPNAQYPRKENFGPNLKVAEAQGSGQFHRTFVGPSTSRIGEKSVRPIGSFSQINFRAASKGRTEENTGMENSNYEEAQECERSAIEDRVCQETNSSKDHGRRKSNDSKHITSRKESQSSVDKAGSKKKDEGKYHGAPGKKLITGTPMEETLSVRVEGGCHLAEVDSQGSVRTDLIQKGGKEKSSPKSSKMRPGDARLGVEGDDDTRAGRRVLLGDAVLRQFDGNGDEISGRVCHYYRESQEKTKSDSGNCFGANRWPGSEWASGRVLGRPKILLPFLGRVQRAVPCPVSSIRALFDGLHFLEQNCPKPKKTDLSLATIFGSPEEGQKENAINTGERAEFRKDADQEDDHNPTNNHVLGPDCPSSSRSEFFSQDKARSLILVNKDRAKNPSQFSDADRYYPPMMLYSSTSSPCLDQIPHLVESFGHGDHDKTPKAPEECVGSQGIALTPLAMLPPSSSERPLCRDLIAVE